MVDYNAYNIISVALFLSSLGWTIYTILSSIGTPCFNMFYAYVTIIILYLKLVWDNFIKPSVED
jgi:hypothetical protein